MNKKFVLKTITLSVITALYNTPLLANPYVQGKGEFATVDAGETANKIDTVTSATLDPVTGILDRSGNPVRIIWYGRPGDQDGSVAQKGAHNAGFIEGKVIAEGKSSSNKDEYQSSINIQVQGNAIDAFGWVARKNTNDVNFSLDDITNSRSIIGKAELSGGEGAVHGFVNSFSSGNGISIAGAAEFGEAISGNGSGSSNGSGRIDGISGASGSAKSHRRKRRSLNTVNTKLDTSTNVNKKRTLHDSDQHGKNIKISLQEINNSDKILGKLVAEAHTADPDMSGYNPQFYNADSLASGNGISLTTFINTPDPYSSSEDKENTIILGNVNNSGTIQGDVLLKGGTNASHTQTKSQGAANGISVYASTGRYAGNKTVGKINSIQNSGNIEGHLEQISGNNSGYESIHMYSGAQSIGSGNGISNYSESYRGSVKETEASIGDINNTGRITGNAYLKAGDGSGDLSIKAQNIGNGVSTYVDVGGTGTHITQIGNIDNKGIIIGQVETHAGITEGSAKKGEIIPEEELKLVVTTKSNFSTYKRPKQLPDRPDEAVKLDQWAPVNHTKNNYTAVTEVTASGNGISGYERNFVDLDRGTNLGNIHNQGVISGYAKMYHGFTEKGSYQRINFLGTGVGVFTDRTMESDIINSGIISGNHAALLVKSEINTRQSVFNPDFNSGYKGKLENYGLMAGTLIAGNYNKGSIDHDIEKQSYQYFTADKGELLNNRGTLVHLKEGISDPIGWPEKSTRYNDAEHIKRIEVGTGGTATINGITYEIINATVNGTDSEYTATDSALNNKIINGVGLTHGTLIANKALDITSSIINGYRTALNIQNNTKVNITDTVLNTNGFNVNKTEKPYIILGDNNKNDVSIADLSILNGNIDLKGGDDVITIKDSSVQVNSHLIDMGEDSDTLNLGENNTSSGSLNDPIKVNYDILNAENIVINKATKIYTDANIKGVNHLTINDKLIYQIDTNNKHALADNGKNITIQGTNGTLLLDSALETTEIALNGGYNFDNGNGVVLDSTNVIQTVELKDGKLIISPKAPTPTTETPTTETPTTETPTTETPTTSTLLTFNTSYSGAYNSLVSSWKNSGINFLKNSSSIVNKSVKEATSAVNNYLDMVVNQSIYASMPMAGVDSLNAYRSTTLNKVNRLLKEGQVDANATLVMQNSSHNSVIDSNDTNALVTDLSYGVSDNITIGASFGAGKEKIKGKQGSHLQGNSIYVGTYLTQNFNDKITWTLGIAHENMKLTGKRIISNGFDTHEFDTNINLSATSIYTQAKYSIPVSDSIKLEPGVGLAYNNLNFNSVSEKGIGALTIKGDNYTTTDFSIGSDVIFNHALDSGNVAIKLGLNYTRTAGQKAIKASFVNGSLFDINPIENKGKLGLKANIGYTFNNGVVLNTNFGSALKSSSNAWNLGLGIGYKF